MHRGDVHFRPDQVWLPRKLFWLGFSLSSGIAVENYNYLNRKGLFAERERQIESWQIEILFLLEAGLTLCSQRCAVDSSRLREKQCSKCF